MEDKKLYDVNLYDDGRFEVVDSKHDTKLNNYIMRFINSYGRGIYKQCYHEDIKKTKEYLVDYKIKNIKRIWNVYSLN